MACLLLVEQIVATAGVHRLKLRDGVPLTVFKNGFMLRRGPFRAYSDASNRLFMADILDGYFPLEFKEEFPDGVRHGSRPVNHAHLQPLFHTHTSSICIYTHIHTYINKHTHAHTRARRQEIVQRGGR